jgi:hypothetical protein
MLDQVPRRRPRVILVGLDRHPDYQTLVNALSDAELDPVPVPDVFVAMGEIAAPTEPAPRAALVSLDALRSSDLAFFTLAKRCLKSGELFFLPSTDPRSAAPPAAIAAGAVELHPDDYTEWAYEIAESHESTADTWTGRPKAAEPAPTRKERAESQTIRVASPANRPIAPAQNEPKSVPHEPGEREPDEIPSPDETESTSPPPMPWQPAANRPTRTPPSKRPAQPPPPSGEADDVELTAEELNALLNGDAPARRRAAP